MSDDVTVRLHTADPDAAAGTEVTCTGDYARRQAVTWTDARTVTFPAFEVDAPAFRAAAGTIVVHVGDAFEQLNRSMIELSRALRPLLHYHSWRELPRRPRIPMRVKYADRNVGPLAVNGRDYTRRQRARRRRRR